MLILSATSDLNEKAMFGIYYVKNTEDRVFKIYSKYIDKFPKFIYYNSASDKFSYVDYNFETYNQFIDKCITFLPSN